MVNRQIYVDLRDIDIADKPLAVNVKGLLIVSTDLFIRFLVERVGEDNCVDQAGVVIVRLLEQSVDFGVRLFCRFLDLDLRLVAHIVVVDRRAHKRIHQDPDADNKYQDDRENRDIFFHT